MEAKDELTSKSKRSLEFTSLASRLRDSNFERVHRRGPRKSLLIAEVIKGLPYASEDYRTALSAHGMGQSMSRTGGCRDNAVAESLFATLRAELVDHETYPTASAAEQTIGEYVERFYNIERLHSHLTTSAPSSSN